MKANSATAFGRGQVNLRLIAQRAMAYIAKFLRFDRGRGLSNKTHEDTSYREPRSGPESKKALGERPSHYYGEEEKGHWFHLEDLLAQIETCAEMIKVLKRVNPSFHHWYRQFGAHVVPHNTMFAVGGLQQRFVKTWPANGMIFMPPTTDDNGGNMLPHILFFDKVNAKSICKTERILLQPTDKRVYRVSHVLKSPDLKHPFGCAFCVGVSDDGQITLLKHKTGMMARFRSGGSRTPGWDYPQELWQMYEMYCEREYAKDRTPDSIETWATTAFAIAANAFSRATEAAQVRVKTGNTTVNVGVPLSRCPSFFKDRSIQAASDGRRKRIFHFVRGHERKLSDGRMRTVKGHYRGARRFEWNGYPVTITVPDRQVTPDQWNVEMHEFNKPPQTGDWVCGEQVALHVSEMLEDGRTNRIQ